MQFKGEYEMPEFDVEARTKKIDEKIRQLQEEKKQLADKVKAEKAQKELGRRLGMVVLKEYEGKPFEYADLKGKLDEVLKTDHDRGFFGLSPLPMDDPRRSKQRGRKTKGNI